MIIVIELFEHRSWNSGNFVFLAGNVIILFRMVKRRKINIIENFQKKSTLLGICCINWIKNADFRGPELYGVISSEFSNSFASDALKHGIILVMTEELHLNLKKSQRFDFSGF